MSTWYKFTRPDGSEIWHAVHRETLTRTQCGRSTACPEEGMCDTRSHLHSTAIAAVDGRNVCDHCLSQQDYVIAVKVARKRHVRQV